MFKRLRFGFSPFYPHCNFVVSYCFVISLILSIYKPQSITNDNQSLHNKFWEKLSALQFPAASLSFPFFSIFLVAKHPSKDDNLEDERLKPFLLEGEGCWVQDLGYWRSSVLHAGTHCCRLCSPFYIRFRSLRFMLNGQYLVIF